MDSTNTHTTNQHSHFIPAAGHSLDWNTVFTASHDRDASTATALGPIVACAEDFDTSVIVADNTLLPVHHNRNDLFSYMSLYAPPVLAGISGQFEWASTDCEMLIMGEGPWHDPPTAANGYTLLSSAFRVKDRTRTFANTFHHSAIEVLFDYLDGAIFWRDSLNVLGEGAPSGNSYAAAWRFDQGYDYISFVEANYRNATSGASQGDSGYAIPGRIALGRGGGPDTYLGRYYIQATVQEAVPGSGLNSVLDLNYLQSDADSQGFLTVMRFSDGSPLTAYIGVPLGCLTPDPEGLDYPTDFPSTANPPTTRGGRCTIRQLMSHASGLIVQQDAR